MTVRRGRLFLSMLAVPFLLVAGVLVLSQVEQWNLRRELALAWRPVEDYLLSHPGIGTIDARLAQPFQSTQDLLAWAEEEATSRIPIGEESFEYWGLPWLDCLSLVEGVMATPADALPGAPAVMKLAEEYRRVGGILPMMISVIFEVHVREAIGESRVAVTAPGVLELRVKFGDLPRAFAGEALIARRILEAEPAWKWALIGGDFLRVSIRNARLVEVILRAGGRPAAFREATSAFVAAEPDWEPSLLTRWVEPGLTPIVTENLPKWADQVERVERKWEAVLAGVGDEVEASEEAGSQAVKSNSPEGKTPGG